MKTNNPNKKFRFIPYRKHDLLEMIVQQGRLSGQENDFRHFYTMLSSVFHFEFHQVMESLKDAYVGINPDADTREYNNTEQLTEHNFVELLGGVLQKANYNRITEAELNQALTESSLFKIRLQVDFDDFAEVLLFCRGESLREETLTSWFGLRSKIIEFINYDRVVVYLRYNDEPQQVQSSTDFKAGSAMLKLFQNVPKADLEMLFPNTQVRMRTIDKLLIGVPAIVSGGIVITTKLGASLILLSSLFGYWLGLSSQPVELNKASIMVLLAGLGALGVYLWKQFSSFKNRKLRFMQTLTQNLYFKNLDNNAGVFYRLVNDAEEEECKEALLAYYILLISPQPLSRAELDKQVEDWMLTHWQCEIDFEIDDALAKLQALKLLNIENEKLSAISISEGMRALDSRWDDYFCPE